MRDGQQATASERSTATQDAHDSWVSAMDLLINAQDLEKVRTLLPAAWDCVGVGQVTVN